VCLLTISYKVLRVGEAVSSALYFLIALKIMEVGVSAGRVLICLTVCMLTTCISGDFYILHCVLCCLVFIGTAICSVSYKRVEEEPTEIMLLQTTLFSGLLFLLCYQQHLNWLRQFVIACLHARCENQVLQLLYYFKDPIYVLED